MQRPPVLRARAGRHSPCRHHKGGRQEFALCLVLHPCSSARAAGGARRGEKKRGGRARALCEARLPSLALALLLARCRCASPARAQSATGRARGACVEAATSSRPSFLQLFFSTSGGVRLPRALVVWAQERERAIVVFLLCVGLVCWSAREKRAESCEMRRANVSSVCAGGRGCVCAALAAARSLQGQSVSC